MMQSFTRRQMLQISGCGFGYLAFAGMAARDASATDAAASNPLAAKAPHFTPRAKRIIMLYMAGGPTHVDTFDYKPRLFQESRGNLLRPPYAFHPSGKSGLPISELFPRLAQRADDLCIVNSMYTDVPNHPQSCLMLHTGEFRFTRPSMGSWLLYGLGTQKPGPARLRHHQPPQ